MVSKSNEKRETKERKGTPKPPDGGSLIWGWMVVAASFILHVISDGVAYTFGLFFVYITQDFQESKSATSWITSIMGGMTYCSGPIGGAIINKLGCRATGIIGSFVAAFGFAISYFAQSVTFLYLSIGLVGGLGLGLIYLPAIVSVTTYFDKRRAFATGIAVCGSGFGTSLLAPIIEILIRRFEWRLALVITGGIIFSCFIFSCFFKPLKETEEDNDKDEEPVDRTPSPPQSDLKPLETQLFSAHYLKPEKPQIETTLNTPCSQPLPRRIWNIDPLQSLDTCWKRNSLPNATLGNGIDQNRYSVGAMLDQVCQRKGILLPIASGPPSYPVKPIPETSTPNNDGSCRTLDNVNTKVLDRDMKEKCGGCLHFRTDIKAALYNMADFTILKDPFFLLFAISNFFSSVGYNVPYTYLVDLAIGDDRDNPIHSIVDASFLLSIVGFTNTVSRVVLGYLSDKSWMNRLYLYNGALTVCGLATAITPHVLMNLNALRVCSGVFGATVGVYVTLTSVILVDFMGLEKLSNAFGLLLLFQGVATVIGPPIVGAFYDHFNNHKYGFGFAGGMIAISGLMLFLIPLFQKPGNVDEADSKQLAFSSGNSSTLCVETIGTITSANHCNSGVCNGAVKTDNNMSNV